MHITKRVAGTLLASLLTLGMAGPALADTPTANSQQSGDSNSAHTATYDARYAIPAAVAASTEDKVAQW